ncbi:hypothetical protein [Mycetocola zhadangensis]|uniref:Uncharacterized protein n=1 Tax=Mycetocola zhadangensis TaxID=1164595 RepID=A0A3L7J6N9_9MICO|nr:hypothetical protein [Mycetocola zhadangensis]RLQ86367.1 hypothetical protein D9V28_05995 [Mycetocola zhadangensis]GGE90604.1 hypothetical protein GCM10011313_11850 [Mycetocola zhadangensis]
MADLANVDLLRRIEELEAENTTLRERDSARPTEPIPSGALPDGPRKGRGWWWTVLATVLIVLGALLAPVALVASWSKTVLTDTDQFVATYAPLSEDPRIQAYVVDEALLVINEQIDIPQITSDVIDGITELGTGPRATEALELLKGPAASGVESLMESGVTTFVESEAFSNVWASALRISHTQLVKAMGADPDAALQLGDDGSVGIQLGPIIDAVKSALLDQGIELANQIPAVDRTIVIAQSDALASVQLAYGAAVTLGSWLPWIAIVLLALGVLVARRRPIALIWAAIALALSMGLALAGFVVGSLALVSALSPDILPSGVTSLLYETVAENMRATAVAVLVLAVVVALVGWLAGPFALPRRLRGFANEGTAVLRNAAERRGITTGRVGVWVYTHRTLLRAAVAVIAAAVVLIVRPVTVGLTLWTLVLAGLVLLILELVQRPVITVPATAEEQVPVVAVE